MPKRTAVVFPLLGLLGLAMSLSLFAATFFVLPGARAQTTTFTVDNTTDAVDTNPGDGFCATATDGCTLRAAVQETNAQPGADLIAVPAGSYQLSLLGPAENDAATGDLDILDDLTIVATGGEVVVDGLNSDRVFDTKLFVPVTLTLRGLTIQHGAPPDINADGGGVHVREGSLILEDMVFRDNQANDNGGGAYVFSGDAMIVRDSVFERNSTLRRGGGLASNVPTTVERVRLTGNTAREGGGIHVSDAPLMLIASTVAANTADGPGGGVRTFRAPATLENSTLTSNRTLTVGHAGGASLGDGSVIRFTTIVQSEGVGLGGPLNEVTVESSIIAGNTEQDCATFLFTVLVVGANLDSDGTCGFSITADAELLPLADNGGSTPTHALGAASLAVDSAQGVCIDADQRGVTRPQGGGCDLGAFELTEPQEGESLPTVELPIAAGFSQIGWLGPSTPVADALAHLDDILLGVWVWDPERNAYLTFSPTAPPFLNSLTILNYGMGLWILTSRSGGARPFPVLSPGSVHLGLEIPISQLLHEGFNFVGYAGSQVAPGFGDRPEDPVAGVFESLGAALRGVWWYDPDTDTFLTYRPDLPASLNTLRTLSIGDAVWILTTEVVTWSYLPETVQANDDGPFAVTGNVAIDTAGGTPVSLFDNDNGVGFVLSAFDAVSVNGGSVSINPDGTFTYDPPAGLTGSDSFTYEITSGPDSLTATVALSISEMIWFIDNAAGSGGDGRLSHPFNTLAAFEAANAAAGVADPAAGHAIFLHSGSGDYQGGVTLQSGQALIGQGAAVDVSTASGIMLAPRAVPLPPVDGPPPVITNASGVGVRLAGDNALMGLIVDGAAVGVHATGLSDASSLDSIVVRNISGHGVEVAGTDLTLTNVLIEQAKAQGLLFSGSGVLSVANSSFRDNAAGGLAADVSSGTMSIVVRGSSFAGNHVGVSLSASGEATVTFELIDNEFNLNRVASINIFTAASHSGSMTGTIMGNVVGTAGLAGSGSQVGRGIRVANEGLGNTTVLIEGNTVQEVGDGAGSGLEGILVVGGVRAGSVAATLRNNAVRRVLDDVGIHIRTTADVVCVDLSSNDLEDIGGSTDLRLSQAAAGLINVTQIDPSAANLGATVSVTGMVNLGQAPCLLP